jgi:GT2 family glycosyltransferase
MAFRRKVLDQIGPFDPLFGSGAFFPSEDADAIMRASLAGWVGLYEPSMIVHHHHGRKAADIGSLHKSYDIGRGAYHAKLLFMPGAFKIALKAWAGLAKRIFVRRSLFYWEMHGALKYLRMRKSLKANV